MKLFVAVLLVAASCHVAHCGNFVRMPFGSPAGVTYVDGSYHAGLAAGPVAYAAVPTLHHVPGVADVPVTRYEAQPGVIQNLVDVAKPAIQTRKFEIRRPAIQKQFYDIEERVVVRPAGSAVVELDEPVSRTQKGPAVIQPATFGVAVTPSPIIQVGQAPAVASTPVPAPVFEQQQSFDDEDSVSIDNPDISRSASPRSGPTTPAPYPQYERVQPQPARALFQPQPQQQQQQPAQLFTPQQNLAAQSRASPAPQSFAPARPVAASPAQNDAAFRSYSTSQTFGPAPVTVSYAAPQAFLPQARFAPATVPSARNYDGPEISHANQQRLIELLTARGGVSEIGFSRSSGADVAFSRSSGSEAAYSRSSGPDVAFSGSGAETAQVRGRVISATPAPAYAQPAGERVNTRRVVVSRPIETLQEVEVAEPVTKLERIQVEQPTLIKTARQDLLRVPTSVPVYGKALAPVAQAAIPLAAHPHPWH